MQRSLLPLASILAFLTGCSESYLPNIGDRDSHGTVIDVQDYGDGCTWVLYEIDPAWQCSDEQITKAEAGWSAPGGQETSLDDADAALAGNVALTQLGCDALLGMARDSMRAANHAIADQTYASALQSCLPTQQGVYYQDGEETSYCSSGGRGLSADGGYATGGTTSSPSLGNDADEGASEYSTTNNQVADVEEADYVKNDSGHVYVLDQTGLRVFDAWPAEETHQLTRIELPGEPRRLLLSGDKLVVFTRLAGDGGFGSPSSQGCTYGYDCRATSEGGTTSVLVYDVSAPDSPVLAKRYDLPGGYVASRRVDDDVYVVIHRGAGDQTLPGIDFDFKGSDAEDAAEKYEGLIATIDHDVAALPDSHFLPDSEGGASDEAACEDALVAEGADGGDLLTLLSFDLTALNEPRSTVLATKPGFVYASADALYLATDGTSGASDPYGYYYATASTDVSSIHKFSLDAGIPRYVGSSAVRGHVLNQFSMDEHDGVLRVAATSGWVPEPGVSSTITTLAEGAEGFARIGELTGLAPTEDIRSVRFDGERGFVVTFKKTDPLFVIGLADPANPAVLGELKIPGFSTYMHPLDRDHLLSVGFDADDHDDFAYFDGIQIQIFDVSDLSAPALLHKKVIGTRGSSSEALTNHLAFNYFAPKSMLVLPITVCEGGDDGVYGTEMTFSGIMAFDISVANGITEHGRMPFADPSQTYDYSYYGGDCSQWWSGSTSNVKRSIFFDDYLFGLSASELRVGQLGQLSTPLVTLPLTDGSTEPVPGY